MEVKEADPLSGEVKEHLEDLLLTVPLHPGILHLSFSFALKGLCCPFWCQKTVVSSFLFPQYNNLWRSPLFVVEHLVLYA